MNCPKDLTRYQIYYSNGVCPYCGFDSNSTICRTEGAVRRWVWDEPELSWWKWLKGVERKGHWEYL